MLESPPFWYARCSECVEYFEASLVSRLNHLTCLVKLKGVSEALFDRQGAFDTCRRNFLLSGFLRGCAIVSGDNKFFCLSATPLGYAASVRVLMLGMPLGREVPV